MIDLRRLWRKFSDDAAPAVPRLGPKHLSELAWWERELRDDVAWYKGERWLYGRPPPEPDEKEIRATIEASACVTIVAQNLNYYSDTLQVARNYFAGKTILDLGCGPLPFSVGFDDCRIVGLDPLIDRYDAAGFPLGEFTDRVTFVRGFAEEMPFPARSFDAVISVNAIDHVDDFARTASEISRVLKNNGVLRMQVHYHAPTELEPQSLSDKEMLARLGRLGIQKLSEKVPSRPCRDSNSTKPIDPSERLVLWANDATDHP